MNLSSGNCLIVISLWVILFMFGFLNFYHLFNSDFKEQVYNWHSFGWWYGWLPGYQNWLIGLDCLSNIDLVHVSISFLSLFVNCIALSLPISGWRAEKVTLGKECTCKGVCWYAVLASIHWRSYWAGIWLGLVLMMTVWNSNVDAFSSFINMLFF